MVWDPVSAWSLLLGWLFVTGSVPTARLWGELTQPWNLMSEEEELGRTLGLASDEDNLLWRCGIVQRVPLEVSPK